MKRVLVIFFIFWFSCVAVAKNINVVILAPFSGDLERYSQEFLNGFELSKADFNVIKIDSSISFLNKLNKIKPQVIVGPFTRNAVNELTSSYCNSSTLIFLPFAKSGNCTNVFHYGYDPVSAAKQLADEICLRNSGSIMVLYSFGQLNKEEKDGFIKELSVCNKQPQYIYSIPTLFNVMNSFVINIFGVKRIKKVSGLTEGKVFEHENNVNTLVIFAPSLVFSQLVNLIDYYDISPDSIDTIDLTVDDNILSLSLRMQKRLNIVTPYYMCFNSKVAVDFLNNYRKKYYTDPTQISALGYDIGVLVNLYLSGINLKSLKDRDFLIGHLLFVDDENNAVLDYKTINFSEVRRCKQQILSR